MPAGFGAGVADVLRPDPAWARELHHGGTNGHLDMVKVVYVRDGRALLAVETHRSSSPEPRELLTLQLEASARLFAASRLSSSPGETRPTREISRALRGHLVRGEPGAAELVVDGERYPATEATYAGHASRMAVLGDTTVICSCSPESAGFPALRLL